MLLDSNIFIEVELAEEHGKACKQLLEKIRDGAMDAVITERAGKIWPFFWPPS
jgi:predicted nucleic acid-binding protein